MLRCTWRGYYADPTTYVHVRENFPSLLNMSVSPETLLSRSPSPHAGRMSVYDAGVRALTPDLHDLIAAYVGPRAYLSLCADRALRGAYLRVHLKDFYFVTCRVTCPSSSPALLERARTEGLHAFPTSIEQAVHDGCMDCLRRARHVGAGWNEDTCAIAASRGHLHCLRHLRENGCPWDQRTTLSAAAKGNIVCLRYACENGCPMDDFVCRKAALNGSVECLRYAHERGCPWDASTTASAAATGRIDCLRYALENGCAWDGGVIEFAARGGHLRCLRFAHEHGCPWNVSACVYAACGGFLDCLRYAHENGCPWDASICARAAEDGETACDTPTRTDASGTRSLARVRQRTGTRIAAIRPRERVRLGRGRVSAAANGRLNCLRYAQENGCPWNGNVCELAAMYSSAVSTGSL